MTDHDPIDTTVDPADAPPPIEQQRAELAETVDALAHKLDMTTRVKASASDSVETVRRVADENRQVVGPAAGALVVVIVAIVIRRRRRSRRKVLR